MMKIVIIIGLIASLITIWLFISKCIPYFWRFKIIFVELSKTHVNRGEEIEIKTIVKSLSRRVFGTVYLVIKIADSYKHDLPVHDTHRDLTDIEKRSLKIVDIPKGYEKTVVYKWTIPMELPLKVYDVNVEVWNPHLLYGGPRKYKFNTSNWNKHFEVMR